MSQDSCFEVKRGMCVCSEERAGRVFAKGDPGRPVTSLPWRSRASAHRCGGGSLRPQWMSAQGAPKAHKHFCGCDALLRRRTHPSSFARPERPQGFSPPAARQSAPRIQRGDLHAAPKYRSQATVWSPSIYLLRGGDVNRSPLAHLTGETPSGARNRTRATGRGDGVGSGRQRAPSSRPPRCRARVALLARIPGVHYLGTASGLSRQQHRQHSDPGPTIGCSC